MKTYELADNRDARKVLYLVRLTCFLNLKYSAILRVVRNAVEASVDVVRVVVANRLWLYLGTRVHCVVNLCWDGNACASSVSGAAAANAFNGIAVRVGMGRLGQGTRGTGASRTFTRDRKQGAEPPRHDSTATC